MFKKNKTNITSGVGTCARNGNTNANEYYCGTGSDCNNFENKTCWNANGGVESTPCKSSDWQCKVSRFFFINGKSNSTGVFLELLFSDIK